jgi:hypothetical protein
MDSLHLANMAGMLKVRQAINATEAVARIVNKNILQRF